MKVALLGAGAMGTGIGQIAATNGHDVVYYDRFPGACERSEASIAKVFDRLVEKGKWSPEQRVEISGRMRWTQDLNDLSGAELVIEAVVEQLSAKQELFKTIEPIVADTALLCSNTSSLSIAAISSVLTNPRRFGGLHFFNPAPLMPLVEIVPGVQTDKSWSEALEKLMLAWGKVPVLAKDTPGFIVNKVARPYYAEAIKLYEEGVASVAQIDAVLKEAGFKMGPFELTDLIGHDVNFTVTETVWTQFYFDPRFRPSITQKRLKEAGMYGRKSGQGFYQYREGAPTPAEVQAAERPLLSEERAAAIVERILCMLANEALDAVWLQIATAQNVDLAMMKGTNYPKGPLVWGEELGWSKVLAHLEHCHHFYGDDRYRPCPLLRQIAAMEPQPALDALPLGFLN